MTERIAGGQQARGLQPSKGNPPLTEAVVSGIRGVLRKLMIEDKEGKVRFFSNDFLGYADIEAEVSKDGKVSVTSIGDFSMNEEALNFLIGHLEQQPASGGPVKYRLEITSSPKPGGFDISLLPRG